MIRRWCVVVFTVVDRRRARYIVMEVDRNLRGSAVGSAMTRVSKASPYSDQRKNER